MFCVLWLRRRRQLLNEGERRNIPRNLVNIEGFGTFWFSAAFLVFRLGPVWCLVVYLSRALAELSLPYFLPAGISSLLLYTRSDFDRVQSLAVVLGAQSSRRYLDHFRSSLSKLRRWWLKGGSVAAGLLVA